MPFTSQTYPASFRVLKQEIKNKAIEIANLLVANGYEEGMAEVIAFSNAKLWMCYLANETSGRKNPGVHLVPHPKGWALISEDAALVHFTSSNRTDALIRSRNLAKNEKLKLFIHSHMGNISDSESFCVNRPGAAQDKIIVENCRNDSMEESKTTLIADTRRVAVRKAKWIAEKVHASLMIREDDPKRRLSF
ncbi:MAG: DUF2188 domain-containing protein [Cytophagaceae bacterium]|nr:DUF2188 domain-containing protein [Cytophagaceae bacterium]